MGNKQAQLAQLEQGNPNNGKDEEKNGSRAEELTKGVALNPKLEVSLGQQLGALVLAGRHCDVEFRVGPKRKPIRAHKLVLAARSPRFEKILFGDAEKKEQETTDDGLVIVELTDVAASIFETILMCCYSDRADLSAHTVQEVLRAAQKYQITALADACSIFMQASTNAENALGRFQLAPESARKFIVDNAGAVFKRKEFLLLKQEELIDFLKCDELAISEVKLFQHVLHWAEERLYASKDAQDLDDDVEGLRKVLKPLIPHIRFPLMSLEDFTAEVAPTKVLNDAQMLEVYQWIAAGKQAEELKMETEFNTKSRSGMSLSFKWAQNLKHNQMVYRDGTEVEWNFNYWGSVLGDQVIDYEKGGIFSFEVELKQYNMLNGMNIMVGCVHANFPGNWGNRNMNGVQQAIGINCPGFTYCLGNGNAYNGGGNGVYKTATRFAQGDKVGVKIEFRPNKRFEGTMTIYKNGEKLCVAHNRVVAPCRPSISLCRPQKTALRMQHFE